MLLGLHHVALGRLLRPLVAVGHLGVEVGLVAAVAVLVDPGDTLELAAQQVNLLEVTAALGLLHHQLDHARLDGAIHPVYRFDVLPAVAFLPGRDGTLRRLQQLGNGAQRVPLKEQVHGLPSGVEMGKDDGCCCHGASLPSRYYPKRPTASV